MSRWSHGHSILVGVLLCLLAQKHELLFAVLLFAAGVLVGRLWARLRSLGLRAAGWLTRPRAPVGRW